ncbi:sulfite exporter TauE/SafE family protein [Microbacterium marinilacus]|uniref:Probable membrane transporter protein n=1 Tax=Microbacterium marinilacus TaxID=415209 RepID=A0ABP7BBH5_9MICO|nr:sulfite exporter TauE/SafE family protein [Microbacterium marinilacus]MBY0687028.1 sulfite exporter TauE/SafE family protein [Microbacterium marinilacus]
MINALRNRGSRAILTFVAIGLLSGFLSGLFGVGGGTVIVPLLVMLAAFGQKLASGTSSAAIIPTAAVGVISYAVNGDVDWIAALLLAAGAVVGAQIGTRLLHRLSEPLLRWIFVGFLVVVMISLFIIVPSRDAELELTFWSAVALVFTGLITGIMSGLIGVGGGIIVVPVLILLFGASDLVAKGTSLLMMIPTTLSGTIGNIRHKNVDLAAGLCLGIAACVTTPLGAVVANAVDPQVANILFVIFLVVLTVQMTQRAIRASRRGE